LCSKSGRQPKSGHAGQDFSPAVTEPLAGSVRWVDSRHKNLYAIGQENFIASLSRLNSRCRIVHASSHKCRLPESPASSIVNATPRRRSPPTLAAAPLIECACRAQPAVSPLSTRSCKA